MLIPAAARTVVMYRRMVSLVTSVKVEKLIMRFRDLRFNDVALMYSIMFLTGQSDSSSLKAGKMIGSGWNVGVVFFTILGM